MPPTMRFCRILMKQAHGGCRPRILPAPVRKSG
jgi:hypothetical protein